MIFTLSDKHYFVSSIYVQSGTHTYINSLGPIYSRYAQEIHEPIQQKWTGNGAKKDSMHPIFQKKKGDVDKHFLEKYSISKSYQKVFRI